MVDGRVIRIMSDDKEKRFRVEKIKWRNGEDYNILAWKFPTGHIATGGIKGKDGSYMVIINELKNYHEPNTKIQNISEEPKEPIFGVIFDNIESIRAIGTNLLQSADRFCKMEAKRDGPQT